MWWSSPPRSFQRHSPPQIFTCSSSIHYCHRWKANYKMASQCNPARQSSQFTLTLLERFNHLSGGSELYLDILNYSSYLRWSDWTLRQWRSFSSSCGAAGEPGLLCAFDIEVLGSSSNVQVLSTMNISRAFVSTFFELALSLCRQALYHLDSHQSKTAESSHTFRNSGTASPVPSWDALCLHLLLGFLR